jgi:hypothetical protein
MACDYCYEKIPRIDEFMSVDQLISILDKLDKNTQQDIVFFGGEPLLNWPIIVEACEYRKRLNSNFEYSIGTNGALLNKEKIEFLIKNNIRLRLSYDGSTTNIHRKTKVVQDLESHLRVVMDIIMGMGVKDYLELSWCITKDGDPTLEGDLKYIVGKYKSILKKIFLVPLIDVSIPKLEKLQKEIDLPLCIHHCFVCNIKDCQTRTSFQRPNNGINIDINGEIYEPQDELKVFGINGMEQYLKYPPITCN